jgi:hypothetical protein
MSWSQGNREHKSGYPVGSSTAPRHPSERRIRLAFPGRQVASADRNAGLALAIGRRVGCSSHTGGSARPERRVHP